MNLTRLEKINHKERAIGRLATQFRESTNLISYIRALLIEADTLEQVFENLLEKRWIDTATGLNLDIIGAIVGQSREFIDAEIFSYFGLADNPQAQSFGSIRNRALGGRFRSLGESIVGVRELSDEEYRLFIRARIFKNSTSSTPEEVIYQIKSILSDVPLVILEDGNTYVNISIGRILSLNEKAILTQTDLVPKTAGVRFNFKTEFTSDFFSLSSSIPGSKGFGSATDPSIGGTFASLF
jgi:hypothetical protein